MKKFGIAFFVICLMCCFALNCYAYNSGISVFAVDKMLNADAIEKNGYSLAPLRAYFESLGYTVSWNDAELSVTALKDTTEIKMICNQKTAYINSKAVDMPCPMVEYNGTTYAPVRSVAELSGYTVSWHDTSKTAIILDKNSPLEFYPNTPHLMPKLECVINNAPLPQSEWTDEKTGIYYKYDGLDEASLLKYGELLEQNYGFKYDSMQLGNDYSKYYIYVSGRTCAMIAVKADSVYIFPSVASSFAFEPIIEQDKSKTQNSDIAENNTPEGNKRPNEEQKNSGIEMYENTQIPDFGKLTGCSFIKQTETESGYPVYAYFGSMFDIMKYLNYLTDYCGFSNYTMNTQPFEMAMTYSISKGDTNVAIVYKMMSDTVYVSYQQNTAQNN